MQFQPEMLLHVQALVQHDGLGRVLSESDVPERPEREPPALLPRRSRREDDPVGITVRVPGVDLDGHALFVEGAARVQGRVVQQRPELLSSGDEDEPPVAEPQGEGAPVPPGELVQCTGVDWVSPNHIQQVAYDRQGRRTYSTYNQRLIFSMYL